MLYHIYDSVHVIFSDTMTSAIVMNKGKNTVQDVTQEPAKGTSKSGKVLRDHRRVCEQMILENVYSSKFFHRSPVA